LKRLHVLRAIDGRHARRERYRTMWQGNKTRGDNCLKIAA